MIDHAHFDQRAINFLNLLIFLPFYCYCVIAYCVHCDTQANPVPLTWSTRSVEPHASTPALTPTEANCVMSTAPTAASVHLVNTTIFTSLLLISFHEELSILYADTAPNNCVISTSVLVKYIP